MNRIREIRLRRQSETNSPMWTATSVARAVGVSDWSYRAWEAGRAAPRARHARRLARVLGVELEELGLGSDPERATGPTEGPASSSD